MDSAIETEKLIRKWIIEEFRLPEATVVSVKGNMPGEEGDDSGRTEITVSIDDKVKKTFFIAKPQERIEREDIKKARIHAEKHLMEKYPFLGGLLRFFGLWFAFSGLYSMFAVCPFCGNAGCPVGAGSVGLVGILFAAGFQSVSYWLKGIGKMIRRFSGEKGKL